MTLGSLPVGSRFNYRGKTGEVTAKTPTGVAVVVRDGHRRFTTEKGEEVTIPRIRREVWSAESPVARA